MLSRILAEKLPSWPKILNVELKLLKVNIVLRNFADKVAIAMKKK